MKLKELLETIDDKMVKGPVDIDISMLAYDSREVGPGALFFAIKGARMDGHKFIKHAIEKGAKAVILEEDEYLPKGITRIKVKDSRKALAPMAAKFFDYPARKLKIIGITGTNGKTTTSYMISNILEAHGLKTGVIGTIKVQILDEIIPTNITTPESLMIQSYLAKMASLGVDVAIMEISSHALYFDRVAEIEFDGAVFTNLSQDHLDFHKDMDQYFIQKAKLFKKVKPDGFAVLNSDDSRTPQIMKMIDYPFITYGIYRHPDLRARGVRTSIRGTHYKAESKKWEIPINMRMLGEPNIYNSLAAVATALKLDIPPAIISKGLETMPGVQGRFELIDEGQNFAVVVDYAHTPDGLRRVLESAKELTENRLITVFGCGGDRDRTKRPVMGRVVAELADVVMITSDNPRTEEPDKIIDQIIDGVKKERDDFFREVDRRTAIHKAIGMAEEGDVIIIAGKGHETYQIFKNETIHFDDAEVARDALINVLGTG